MKLTSRFMVAVGFVLAFIAGSLAADRTVPLASAQTTTCSNLLPGFPAGPPLPPATGGVVEYTGLITGPIHHQGQFVRIYDATIVHDWAGPAVLLQGGYLQMDNVVLTSTMQGDDDTSVRLIGATGIVRNTVINATNGTRLPVRADYGSYLWTSDTQILLPANPAAFGIYLTSSWGFFTSGTEVLGQGMGYGGVFHRSSLVNLNDVRVEGVVIGLQSQYGSISTRHSPSVVNTVSGLYDYTTYADGVWN